MTKQQFAAFILELKDRLDDADRVAAEIQAVQKQVAILQNNNTERSKLMGAALCRVIAAEQSETFEAVFARHAAAISSNKREGEYLKTVLGN